MNGCNLEDTKMQLRSIQAIPDRKSEVQKHPYIVEWYHWSPLSAAACLFMASVI